MKRREFIQLMGILSAAACVPFGSQDQAHFPYLISPGKSVYTHQPCILVFDVLKKEFFHITTPEESHSILHLQGNLFLAVAQRPNKVSFVFDVQKRQIVQTVESLAGHHFYGHAAIDPDQKFILTTENSDASNIGVIVKRDFKTLAVVEKFPSHGSGPHEISFLPGTRKVFVVNGGSLDEAGTLSGGYEETSSACVIDFDTKALDEKIISDNGNVSFRHFHVAHDGWVYIANQNRSKEAQTLKDARAGRTSEEGISIKNYDELVYAYHPKTKEKKKFITDKKLQQDYLHHILSIAVSQDLLALTAPFRGHFSIVNRWTNKILVHEKIWGPAGTTFSRSRRNLYFTTQDPREVVIEYDLETLSKKSYSSPGLVCINHSLLLA